MTCLSHFSNALIDSFKHPLSFSVCFIPIFLSLTHALATLYPTLNGTCSMQASAYVRFVPGLGVGSGKP